jgi:endonuclease/exonuclease/phosphatase (EEP) superfamily protein YafD
LAILLLSTFTALLVLATILPWVPWPHGIVRVCDFPRVQIAALAGILLIVTVLVGPGGVPEIILVALQFAVMGVQAMNCVRFTWLHPVQSLDHDGGAEDLSVLRILSANIKMSNRRFAALLELIRERRPDVAIVMEVDEAWVEALQPLKEDMPYAIEWPRDNTYGMALLSRLPLIEPELRFLVLETVPSVRTGVRLRSGEEIRIYAVHPEPPVPYEDTIGRDGELVLVAAEVKKDPLPAIVTGDLNDVAWSRTTRRFQRLTGLLDPRVGRGLFSTFDARYPFLRWPLDHLFHDPQFRVVSVERLRHIGSDHFPILFALALHRTKRAGAEPSEADSQDLREARELASDSAAIERKPIGADWEQQG